MGPIEVSSESSYPTRTGLFLLYACVVFVFLLLVCRFWYLQILHGTEFSRLAYSNRTRTEMVYATRGILTDVEGRLLAENRPAYCLAIIPEDCPDIAATLAQISRWTELPPEQIQTRFRPEIARMRSFEQQMLVADIPFDKVAAIEQQLYQWPGVSIVTRQRRYYPYGSLFAHILGYVAEANEKDMREDPDLALGDIVGKSGLELVMEKDLRGTKGRNSVEVDVLGRHLKKKQEVQPEAGQNIVLALDVELQRKAAEAMGDQSGSIVVLEPETGRIRALVTSPSYDNNLFTSRLSQKDWSDLSTDTRHPLQSRTIQSTFPPGSVWKLMMVGLFLEQGIDPKTTVACYGSVVMGNRTFRCWRAGGHGSVNMMQALVVSCDVYFYEISQKVGIDNIERYGKASGFGAPTGIDLPHERSGLVPGRAWKLSRFKEGWQRGETLNVSIGQGFTLVTPLQMAVFTAGLLNGGKLMRPLLCEHAEPEVKGILPMKAAHRDFIKESMRVTAESGTARRVFRQDAVMGGKTGTAQVVKLGDRRIRASDMRYEHRDHAWMTTWGEKDGKSYVVVVMVEHGGGGGSAAGPVAAKVYEALWGPDTGPQVPQQ